MHQGWVLLYSNPTLISNPGSDGFVEKIRENVDWETEYKAKDQKGLVFRIQSSQQMLSSSTIHFL